MIAALASDPPRSVAGLVVVVLVLTVIGCGAVLAWDAEQRRVDMERREQYRRDTAGQRQWDETKRAMAARHVGRARGPRCLP